MSGNSKRHNAHSGEYQLPGLPRSLPSHLLNTSTKKSNEGRSRTRANFYRTKRQTIHLTLFIKEQSEHDGNHERPQPKPASPRIHRHYTRSLEKPENSLQQRCPDENSTAPVTQTGNSTGWRLPTPLVLRQPSHKGLTCPHSLNTDIRESLPGHITGSSPFGGPYSRRDHPKLTGRHSLSPALFRNPPLDNLGTGGRTDPHPDTRYTLPSLFPPSYNRKGKHPKPFREHHTIYTHPWPHQPYPKRTKTEPRTTPPTPQHTG